MLSNKRMTLIAETIIDDVKIASYGAILDLSSMDLSFTSRQIDKGACKTYKEVVREDQAEFEDYAYIIQDLIINNPDSFKPKK